MSISFRFEKVKDMPLKCFRCPHMLARLEYQRFTWQCEFDRCAFTEKKKEKKDEQ